jgi:RNA polymerase sigma factor (sigma-70 family)
VFRTEPYEYRAGLPPIRVDHQRLLLDHLDLVDQIVRTTGRRRHLSTAEQDDFAGFVKLRLVEDDYAILRKFQNRSSLWTYLAAVIERLSLDFCVEKWGRWRPSAMAERLGAPAVVLERLVNRDGHSLEEAIEMLRTHHDFGLTDRAVHELWEQLPVRNRTTEVGEEAAAGVRSLDSSEERIENAGRQVEIEKLEHALRAAFSALADHDRLVIALRFEHDLPVAQIAKTVNSSVATVHRRIERGLKDLRAALSGAGFHPRDVAALIGHSTVILSPLLRAEVEKFSGPVRLSNRDD